MILSETAEYAIKKIEEELYELKIEVYAIKKVLTELLAEHHKFNGMPVLTDTE